MRVRNKTSTFSILHRRPFWSQFSCFLLYIDVLVSCPYVLLLPCWICNAPLSSLEQRARPRCWRRTGVSSQKHRTHRLVSSKSGGDMQVVQPLNPATACVRITAGTSRPTRQSAPASPRTRSTARACPAAHPLLCTLQTAPWSRHRRCFKSSRTPNSSSLFLDASNSIVPSMMPEL
ncbi:hypothetical protein IWX50DRAFT_34563 [Phyllosticta citricarpa]